MQQIKDWYAAQDANDQRLVLFAAVFFAGLLLVFGLLKPLSDAVSEREMQLEARQRSVDSWREAMPKILASRGNGNQAGSNQALNTIVTSTSRQFSLNVSRLQEKGSNEIQVWFDNVEFNSFLRWVAELQQSYGASVESVNIRSAKERVGLVSIDVKINKN